MGEWSNIQPILANMNLSRPRLLVLFCFSVALLVGTVPTCSRSSTAQTLPAALQANVTTPFKFVAYGDTRFHDPHDTDPANPVIRQDVVQAIAAVNPAFICFTGDIVYNGYDTNDWHVWDQETSVWREKKISVYPALGNHELHGNESVALGNYFARFPYLNHSRYYSVRAGSTLLLAIDSSLDKISGPQGQWLANELDHVPSDVNFVFVMDHHPPYTSSSDSMFGGGHSARPSEKALATMLEEQQAHAPYRIIVFSGHVHNYERHEHGGIMYFVTGGGGAHPYLIKREPGDLFLGSGIYYHYLLVEVNQKDVKITMHRLQLGADGKEIWTTPDQVEIGIPQAAAAHAGR